MFACMSFQLFNICRLRENTSPHDILIIIDGRWRFSWCAYHNHNIMFIIKPFQRKMYYVTYQKFQSHNNYSNDACCISANWTVQIFGHNIQFAFFSLNFFLYLVLFVKMLLQLNKYNFAHSISLLEWLNWPEGLRH